MRIWIVKHKGKNWWGNMWLNKMEFTNDEWVWSGYCFYRKKDAVKFLKAQGEDAEYYEIKGATLDESKQDNRRR